MFEVRSGGWEETAVLLVGLFIGGATLAVAFGIWDLLSSEAAQSAFGAAIKAVGYGVAALLVLAGLGGFAYGASFFVKSTAPLKLSEGVRDHGGMFRNDGIVVVLPKHFHKLPPEAQRKVVAALIETEQRSTRRLPSGKTLEMDGGNTWGDATRTNY